LYYTVQCRMRCNIDSKRLNPIMNKLNAVQRICVKYIQFEWRKYRLNPKKVKFTYLDGSGFTRLYNTYACFQDIYEKLKTEDYKCEFVYKDTRIKLDEKVFNYNKCEINIVKIKKFKLLQWIDPTKLLNMEWLSINPNAIDYLEANPEKIDWDWLSGTPNAIHILEQNIYKINWCQISGNPSAIHILETNIEKINWSALSANPEAIHILEKNLDRIHWERLSSNPNAIHILEANQDKIYWNDILLNPSIFE
jgi:hypothetical protein